MTMIAIAATFVMILCVSALRANTRLRDESRLPMQWWLTGEVTWHAPRQMALAVIPALASILFAGLAVLSVEARPRPGQETMILPTLIGIGVMFLAIQRLYLWLVEQTLRRNGG